MREGYGIGTDDVRNWLVEFRDRRVMFKLGPISSPTPPSAMLGYACK